MINSRSMKIFILCFISGCVSSIGPDVLVSEQQLDKISIMRKMNFSELENEFSTANGDYQTFIFKSTSESNLRARVWKPQNIAHISRSAIVFFYGGGWESGTIEQFSRQASYFSSLGVTAITVDYRIKNLHGVTPAESLTDAKSALRWVRKNASKFNVFPDRIVAVGSSAGGHLAAATAVVDGFNDVSDDQSISAIPNALVLFNPVIDNSPEGYGNEKVSAYWSEFSPLHNIKQNPIHPPTLVLSGSNDKLISIETCQLYVNKIQASGAHAKLIVYENEPHGFFNKRKFLDTLIEMHTFLYEHNHVLYPPVKR